MKCNSNIYIDALDHWHMCDTCTKKKKKNQCQILVVGGLF